MMTGAILGVVFAAYVFHIGWTGIVFLLIGGLAVGLPLDKWMDGHLRRLEPREANSASVLIKYLKALLFFLITYLFVAIFCSLIITSLLFGRLIIYVGTSDDWRIWPANILGILAGIYAAEAALNPKPRKNKNRG
ncbi:hypothetical protein VB713_01235 [Anabaena cylindrica UHCC 0172]|nr:hypothetical protein [Anabaena cylindrica UHCC 0172]